MKDRIGRRDFLRPGHWLAGAPEISPAWSKEAGDQLEDAKRWPVATFRRPAMACLFEIQTPADSVLRRHIPEAFDWIDAVEAQLSVYREDSEISRINRLAGNGPIAVEERLFALLERCAGWTRQTEGALDVTAGPLIRAWGFYRRQGRVPSRQELHEALAVVGMDKVRLDPENRTVEFLAPGVEINLGAVGKGFALDEVGRFLTSVAGEDQSSGPPAALLSAGHSSILAIGRPPWDLAWHVELPAPRPAFAQSRPNSPCKGERNDRGAAHRSATVRLFQQGLSTTGSTEQWFEHEGRRYGHVIDPRTGHPTGGLTQMSAIANDAATAEAMSTAFFVNGLDWTRRFIEQRADEAGVCAAVCYSDNEIPPGPIAILPPAP